MTYSTEQLELKAYLLNEQAATQAWIAEDPENRGAAYYTVDLDHWAEAGVFSVDDLKRYDAIATYVDMYKDIHGIKPRWINWDEFTTQAIEAKLESLYGYSERVRDHELWLEGVHDDDPSPEAAAHVRLTVQDWQAQNHAPPNNPFAEALRGL